MKTLVDTCVLSEARHPQGSRRVRDRLAAIEDRDLYLSVVTIGEIVKGIELLPKSKKKHELEVWIRDLQDHHADRILPIDLRVARVWGQMSAKAQQGGVILPAADGLIAATALRHDLLVMTRNTAHFESAGVRLENPWLED